jgi:hypothetical protein
MLVPHAGARENAIAEVLASYTCSSRGEPFDLLRACSERSRPSTRLGAILSGVEESRGEVAERLKAAVC